MVVSIKCDRCGVVTKAFVTDYDDVHRCLLCDKYDELREMFRECKNKIEHLRIFLDEIRDIRLDMASLYKQIDIMRGLSKQEG